MTQSLHSLEVGKRLVVTPVTLETNLKIKVTLNNKKLLALKNPTILGNALDMKLKVFPTTTRGNIHFTP